MWEKLRIVFTIPELRQKIILTLLLWQCIEFGYQISPAMVPSSFDQNSQLSGFLDKVSVFAATTCARSPSSVWASCPTSPHRSYSTARQRVWKPIENLRKEGQTGMRKINEYTRYLTVFLCILQSWI